MIPFHLIFLCIWVTASSKGEGSLHRKSTSKCCNYSQRFTVSTASSPRVKWSIDFNYVSYGFNGKWCQNRRGKHNCKNWVAESGHSWLYEQMMVNLQSFLPQLLLHQWICCDDTRHCIYVLVHLQHERSAREAQQLRWCACLEQAFKSGANHNHSKMRVWLRKEEIEFF